MRHLPLFVHVKSALRSVLRPFSGRKGEPEATSEPEPQSVQEPAAEKGLKMAMLGWFAEAAKLFQQAEASGDHDAGLYYNWGLALSHQGEHEKALEKYSKALELEPGLADALINSGVSLAALGRYEEAIERYRLASEADSNLSEIYFNWGISLASLGKLEEAVKQFEEAARISPMDQQARFNLGVLLYRLNKKEEAKEHLNAFVGLARTRFPEQLKRAKELLEEIEYS